MSDPLFGTDGIRGTAGEEPLTEPTVERLGGLLAAQLEGACPKNVIVGHDGRESGPMLSAALAAGFCAAGWDVDDVGLTPTPVLMFLTAHGGYGAGAMISASHNPASDNGIKLLGIGGTKLADEQEAALEGALLQGAAAPSGGSGRVRIPVDPHTHYLGYLRESAFPTLDLTGMKILVDAANGAFSELASEALTSFGATVERIHCAPDGRNINAGCGALHPETAAAGTKEVGAALGIAFDGDGDRSLFADKNGRVLDGDAVLYGLGKRLCEQNRLANNTIVATVMSNLALERGLDELGIALERTPVGDRHVAAMLRGSSLSLGGEKSGHILFGERSSYRGDGLFTALELLAALQDGSGCATEFAADYSDYPQQLWNVPVTRRCPLEQLPRLMKEEQEVLAELAGRGRSVIRFSGTELLLRLMVEAETDDLVEKALARLLEAARLDGVVAGEPR